MARMDLTGQTFTKWTVLRETEKRNKKRMWLCRCECGNTVVVCQANLKSGKSTQCLNCRPGQGMTTHGLAKKHPLYTTWVNMRARCNNSRSNDYKYYGGRGITVCERWNDFTLFVEDMYSTYQKGLTLDRKENNGNYEPSNCRWISRLKQSNNTRLTLKIEYEGKFYSESALARHVNVPRSTIQDRRRKGWTLNEIINGKN